MWVCPKCGETVDDPLDACWSCGTSEDGTEDPHFRPEPDGMPLCEDRLRLDGSMVFLFYRWGAILIVGPFGLLAPSLVGRLAQEHPPPVELSAGTTAALVGAQLVSGFAIWPALVLLGAGVARIRGASPRGWRTPSWFRNPLDFSQPLEFLHFAMWFQLVGGVGLLLGTLFALSTADVWLLMSVPFAIAGVSGAWVAMRLYMAIYRDKRIETDPSTKSTER